MFDIDFMLHSHTPGDVFGCHYSCSWLTQTKSLTIEKCPQNTSLAAHSTFSIAIQLGRINLPCSEAEERNSYIHLTVMTHTLLYSKAI